MIHGLLATGKYKFKVFGGAVKHDDYNDVVVSEDFIIKPTNGFGDKNMLRLALAQIKPDAVLLFTDPRFFMWVWEMEDEVHQICPITYNHLWDNWPWPEFNRHIYESTDLINCINWSTYQMVSERFPEKTNYIPHAVPKELFRPLPRAEVNDFKIKLLGKDRADHFIALYVSRNARRKMTGDIMVSWRQFLDSIEEKYGHKKATLVMHTDPLDPEGQNLHHVIHTLKLKDNVVFSKERVGFNEMVTLYNICDVVVNRSCFVAGTRVVIQNKGYVPIEDVVIGDCVLTHNNRWMPVVDTIKNHSYDKRLLKFNISNSNEFTCTDTHKLLAVKRNELPKWFQFKKHIDKIHNYKKLTPANELSVGDYVIAEYEAKQTHSENNTNLSLWNTIDQSENTYNVAGSEHSKSSIYSIENERIVSHIYGLRDHGPTEVKLSEAVAYVLGNWTADGSTNTASVAFNKKDTHKIEKYAKCLYDGFRINPIIKYGKKCTFVNAQNGSILAKLFKLLCGSYSHGKHVPVCIKNANIDIQRSYLEGYKAGDGCTLTHPTHGHKTHRIRTVSNAIAFELRQLLINLRYVPNVFEHSNSHGYNKNGRIWTIEWRDRVGNVGANGSCRSWSDGSTVVSRINAISETTTDHDYVYDLTVKDDHTYMIENTTVSNCNEGFGLGLLEAKMCAKPVIAVKTGGMTRQVEDHITGEQYGIALEPEVKSLVGNQLVPYIYEDFVSHKTLTDAFLKMYEMPKEHREALGQRALLHTQRDYDLDRVISKWDETLTNCMQNWKTAYKKWEHIEI